MANNIDLDDESTEILTMKVHIKLKDGAEKVYVFLLKDFSFNSETREINAIAKPNEELLKMIKERGF